MRASPAPACLRRPEPGSCSPGGSTIGRPETGRPHHIRLFDFDVGAGFFELLLDVFGFVLGDGLLDRVGSAVDQVLGFFQAQAGDGADLLDDVDLLLAGSLEDDVELRLFFFLNGGSSGGRGRRP